MQLPVLGKRLVQSGIIPTPTSDLPGIGGPLCAHLPSPLPSIPDLPGMGDHPNPRFPSPGGSAPWASRWVLGSRVAVGGPGLRVGAGVSPGAAS